MKNIRLVGVIILCTILLLGLIIEFSQPNNVYVDIIKGQVSLERIENKTRILKKLIKRQKT